MIVTRERRRRALTLIRHSNVSRLSADAALVLVVGMLIADDEGHIDRQTLAAAAQDSDTCAVAAELLRQATS